jgi:hypothetical protein
MEASTMLRETLEALFFQTALLLSPLALIAYAVLVRRRLRGRPSSTAMTAGLVVFPLALLVLVWRVLGDRSSTAAVALFVVPTLAAAAAGLVSGWIWSIGVLLRALPKSGSRRPGPLLAAVAILASSLWLGGTIARQEWLLRQASAPEASPGELRALAARPDVRKDPVVLAALAAHPGTPPDVLSELAGSDAPELARVPRPWLSKLLLRPAGEPESVLSLLARNPATPAAALARLALQSEPSVRAAVALRQDAPAEALARLARDPEPAVRLTVAANLRTAPSVLEALARDPDTDTRIFVAANPNTPLSALELLAHDPDEKVRTYAARALQNPSRR